MFDITLKKLNFLSYKRLPYLRALRAHVPCEIIFVHTLRVYMHLYFAYVHIHHYILRAYVLAVLRAYVVTYLC